MHEVLICVSTLVCLFLPAVQDQYEDEGWVTHTSAVSVVANTAAYGSMHAEKGTAWLIFRDLEKDRERTRVKGGGPIRSMSFSRDGKLLAASEDGRGMRIFETATGKQIKQLKGHRSWVWAVALSPDGKRAASGGMDGTFRLWDVDKGVESWSKKVDKQVGHLLFTPDGKTVVAAKHNGAHDLWGLDGKLQASLEHKLGPTSALGISADGRWLASGHKDRWLVVWDLATKKLYKKFQMPAGRIYSIAFSPESKRLACTTGKRGVHERELESGKATLDLVLSKESGNAFAIRYSTKLGLVAIGYEGKTMRLRAKPASRPATRPTGDQKRAPGKKHPIR